MSPRARRWATMAMVSGTAVLLLAAAGVLRTPERPVAWDARIPTRIMRTGRVVDVTLCGVLVVDLGDAVELRVRPIDCVPTDRDGQEMVAMMRERALGQVVRCGIVLHEIARGDPSRAVPAQVVVDGEDLSLVLRTAGVAQDPRWYEYGR